MPRSWEVHYDGNAFHVHWQGNSGGKEDLAEVFCGNLTSGVDFRKVTDF